MPRRRRQLFGAVLGKTLELLGRRRRDPLRPAARHGLGGVLPAAGRLSREVDRAYGEGRLRAPLSRLRCRRELRLHPVASRRLRPAARLPARLHRHVADVGARAAGARAALRRARADAARPRRRAAARRARRRRVLVDAVERAMDEAGFETAHVAGNSLGGFVALQLAARGRARSVVALAPAGGWAADDDSYRETARQFFTAMQELRAGGGAVRRRDRRRRRRPPPGDRADRRALRAHPARARRAPDRRRGELRASRR